MDTLATTPADTSLTTSPSAVSWAAVIAGGVVAAAVSLILAALGSGLGFSAVSPWPSQGIGGMTLTVTAAVWLILTQWISAGIGGYVAGRLRTRWIGTHTHEVFFRDTAHGLLSWALATLVVAGLLASTLFASIGIGAHAATVSAGTSAGSNLSYFTDRAFRNAEAKSGAPGGDDPRVETAHILTNSAIAGGLSDADRSYLVQLVAARTGVGDAEAQRRVDDMVNGVNAAEAKTREAADTARKAAAEAAIYLALSLLVGAFIASISAALGGQLRDKHP
jgi:hypothetical protein